MLVKADHYHFNTEECGKLSIHREVCSQAREFYCSVHDVYVGPSGYEWSHIPPVHSDQTYTDSGCWLFLCSLIRSMTDKIDTSGKLPTESADKYSNRILRHRKEIKEMRIALAMQYWKPIVMYSDISGTDYSRILKAIVKHNS